MNVFDEPQQTTPAGARNRYGIQVDASTLRGDVRLVTLTIGGNDLEFAEVVHTCAIRACLNQPFRGSATLGTWATAQLSDIGARLTDTYQRLKSAAPKNARVLVLGYPRLFPEFTTTRNSQDCSLAFNAPGGLGWDAQERDRIRKWGADLNARIAAAADTAHVEYVPIAPFFALHEPCGLLRQWISFVQPRNVTAVGRGSFHPNATGQAELARIVTCYLRVYQHTPPQTANAVERAIGPDYVLSQPVSAISGCLSTS